MTLRPQSSPDPSGTRGEPDQPIPVVNPTESLPATPDTAPIDSAPPGEGGQLPGSTIPNPPPAPGEAPAPGAPPAAPNGSKGTISADGGFAAGPATKTGGTPSPTTGIPDDGGRHRGSSKGKGPFSFLKELPALIIIAFLLALLIKSFLVQAFYIPSGSMEPTLDIGDRVLVNKLAYKFNPPSRFDVIVFSDPTPGPAEHRGAISGFLHWVTEGLGFSAPPNEDFIKRVIGLPGDTVEERNGVIYVNGKPLKEPYVIPDPTGSEPRFKDRRSIPPVKVEAGHLFVLGDNRANSNDSRYDLGQIPIDKVIGKAFIKIWPPSHSGGLTNGGEVALAIPAVPLAPVVPFLAG